LVEQFDLSIETFVSIFSKQTLQQIFTEVKTKNGQKSAETFRMLNLETEYLALIDPVITFLQGKNNAFANSLSQNILPRGKRFDSIADLEWLFGTMGIGDKAKYLSTLFIEDIGDFIVENIDKNFGFSRYAEQIGLNAINFDKIESELESNNILTNKMYTLLDEKIQQSQPRIVGFTIPFPGNLLAALKSAKFIKEKYPDIIIVFGGGFVNTEIRNLNEKKIFKYIDYLCLDDGEMPLKKLLDFILKGENKENLCRTYCFENNEITYINNPDFQDISHNEIGTPNYSGLPIEKYVSFLEIANPMHRLWSDGFWNKITIAHGCYWHKCSFCDTSLDYIKRYSCADVGELCNRIESIIAQTGKRTFHFVDEAAPPTVLRDLAIELLRRNIKISWWTNIRFEKTFSADFCRLLAESGCIAVSGGLEVASDRLLAMMQKGVTVEQVAQVCKNLSDAGIMIHAYLMYGFPTQTAQETLDSLEIVRQLFEQRLVQSGFWHRFTMTIHSPIGLNPQAFNVKKVDIKSSFAQNDCKHEDPIGCDHDMFSFGLKKALYNFMHEQCFDFEMQDWFDFRVPKTSISANLISTYLSQYSKSTPSPQSKTIWINSKPSISEAKKNNLRLYFDTKQSHFYIELSIIEAEWVVEILNQTNINCLNKLSFENLVSSYETTTNLNFIEFSKSKNWKLLRKNGLLIV